MNFLKVAEGKYINLDRVTHVHTKKDTVYVIFQEEPHTGGIGIPPSFCELKDEDARKFLQWLDTHADHT